MLTVESSALHSFAADPLHTNLHPACAGSRDQEPAVLAEQVWTVWSHHQR